MSLIQRANRAIAFGGHIPPRKLARRLWLTAARRLRDRFGWPRLSATPAPPVRDAPPLPLFAPRAGMTSRAEQGLAFTFLNLRHPMGASIDWRAPGEGSAHQLWRMNLHYMEYLEEAGDADFCDLAAQWITANPQQTPGAWRDSWNSYALSLRVVVWMQQLALRGACLRARERAAMDACLAAQLRFLERNLETDLGGNHLVKNLKALIWAGAYFQGAEASDWRAAGLRLLDGALREQVLADGVHYERSPSYHCQVFADFLECRHALGAGALEGRLDAALAQMARATADLAHPDGLVAQFNDAGLRMAYAPGECLDVHERLFASRPKPRAVFAFPNAGYFGMRSAETCFIADCGRIAPDDLPAHGHGDILSFEWSVRGERIIVDPGVYEYIAGEKRDFSRAASSHNTLCFEGADQADFFGAFRCGRRPDVSIRALRQNGRSLMLEGTHDGFSSLPGAPRHVRRLEAEPLRLVIHDIIEGAPDRPANVNFRFHPDVRLEKLENGIGIVARNATILMKSSAPVSIVKSVWWPDMGCEQPTFCARLTVDRGVSSITTTFDVLPEKPAAPSEAS